MPYFQLESSTSLPEQRYFPVAFIRTALAYQQTGDKKAVMELPPSMDAAKTLTHYKQKISAKKSVLAPAKITLTELTLAEYDAAGRAPPIPAPPQVDRSRSPPRTMARRMPLETVREQLDKMQQGELQQVMALCAARMFTCHVVSPQTTLLEYKAGFQRELLQKPFTEWADAMAPFIASCRANPQFCERDVTRYEQHSRYECHPHRDLFHEATQFLYNLPPHE